MKKQSRTKAQQVVDLIKRMTPEQMVELAGVWAAEEPEHLRRLLRSVEIQAAVNLQPPLPLSPVASPLSAAQHALRRTSAVMPLSQPG